MYLTETNQQDRESRKRTTGRYPKVSTNEISRNDMHRSEEDQQI